MGTGVSNSIKSFQFSSFGPKIHYSNTATKSPSQYALIVRVTLCKENWHGAPQMRPVLSSSCLLIDNYFLKLNTQCYLRGYRSQLMGIHMNH